MAAGGGATRKTGGSDKYSTSMEADARRWEGGEQWTKYLKLIASQNGWSFMDALERVPYPSSSKESERIMKETGLFVPVSTGFKDQQMKGPKDERRGSYGYKGMIRHFHAEQNVFADTKATAIGVEGADPCPSCQVFFRGQARALGETIVICGPNH